MDNNVSYSADPPMNPGRSDYTFPQVNIDLFSEGDLFLQVLYNSLIFSIPCQQLWLQQNQALEFSTKQLVFNFCWIYC
jgi:hypothetical protein